MERKEGRGQIGRMNVLYPNSGRTLNMYIRKLDASARSRRVANFWKSFANDATTAWNPCTSASGKF